MSKSNTITKFKVTRFRHQLFNLVILPVTRRLVSEIRCFPGKLLLEAVLNFSIPILLNNLFYSDNAERKSMRFRSIIQNKM